eukprot:1155748-Pelagomonas_calceolata.AAC.4
MSTLTCTTAGLSALAIARQGTNAADAACISDCHFTNAAASAAPPPHPIGSSQSAPALAPLLAPADQRPGLPFKPSTPLPTLSRLQKHVVCLQQQLLLLLQADGAIPVDEKQGCQGFQQG